MRKKNIFSEKFSFYANWKMNKNPQDAQAYIHHITHLLSAQEQKQFVFFVPALTLSALTEKLSATQFGWGAQNCHFEDQGAFTGENSPLVLKQMGATHCLVGHSERRQLFLENDALIRKKVSALLKHSLQPIICVGETAEERKKGNSLLVVERQLSGILQNKGFPSSFICVAYEPVWAIGSARPASIQQISDMQTYIQQLCESEGKKLHFLYGGSVSEKNVKELSQIPGVNGFLIGGASLDPERFFNLFQKIKGAG